jgi:hypothetical protein
MSTAGVGKMTWLIDFEGYSLRNAPAVRTSLGVLHILQNHYPERLGGAVCYHAPGLFSMTWKVGSGERGCGGQAAMDSEYSTPRGNSKSGLHSCVAQAFISRALGLGQS